MPRHPRILPLAVLAALIFVALVPGAAAAPGDLDPGFGVGGEVKLLQSEEEVSVKGIAVQADDKIVLGGAEAPGDVMLYRLLPNGEPDILFGVVAKAKLSLPGFSEARAVIVQPDGKIVAAGGAENGGNGDFLIARFNPDGKPDSGFGGGDGAVVLPVGAEFDEAESVALGADGRIVAAGRVDAGGGKEEELGVAVVSGDGTPDPEFAGDGTTAVKTPVGFDSGDGVVVRPDKRIVVADESGAGIGKGFTLVQLLSDGKPDPGFGGGDGIAIDPVPGDTPTPSGRSTDLALLGDGRVVASGYGYDEIGSPPMSGSKFAVARYLADGQLDPAFGSGGFLTVRTEGESDVDAVEVGAGGRLILAGTYSTPTDNEEAPAVLRLTPAGALDPAFGAGGMVLRPQSPFGELVESAALDSQERLVTVSTQFIGGGATTHNVARYLGDPRPAVTAASANHPPHAQMKKVPKAISTKRLSGFSGTATDSDGEAVARVEVALVRLVRGGARAARRAKSVCFALTSPRASFKRIRVAKGGSCPQLWLPSEGTQKWDFKLKRKLPPGRYVVYARAVDGRGLAETKFDRDLGNRYAFRALAPRPKRR